MLYLTDTSFFRKEMTSIFFGLRSMKMPILFYLFIYLRVSARVFQVTFPSKGLFPVFLQNLHLYYIILKNKEIKINHLYARNSPIIEF